MRGLMMDYPLTVVQMLQRSMQLFPKKEIVSVDFGGKRFRYNYEQLYDRVLRLMDALRRLGVKRGDRVATFAWNDHRHLELYFAVPCMGAVLHTLNVRLFPEQLEYIVNHAEDKVVFYDASLAQTLEPLAPKFKCVDEWVEMASIDHPCAISSLKPSNYEALLGEAMPQDAFPNLDENDACGLCYTSGTTGLPKGALYSHRAMFLHTLCLLAPDALGLSEKHCMLPVVPLFHANAWGAPFAAAMAGPNLIMAGRDISPNGLVPLIEEEEVDIAMGVPTIWSGILEHWRQHNMKPSTLKQVVIGGAPVPRQMIVDFEEEMGVEVVQAWGMTELTPVGSFSRLTKEMQAWSKPAQYDVRATIGRAVSTVELKIVDEDGHDLPWDNKSMGELLVRGPSVAKNYYKNESEADRFTSDGWFLTGDMAVMDHRGTISIKDRSKDLIKSGGEWISSVDMENAIMSNPRILEASVVARADARWGERPVAFVVVRQEPDLHMGATEIISALSQHFAKWQLPAHEDVHFVEKIPRTSVGKFDKKVLRTQLG